MKPGRSSRLIADAFRIFEAATVTEAGKRLGRFTQRWRRAEPLAVRSLYRDFTDCLTYLAYDDPVRTRPKTNNPLERYFQEIERRTVPMRAFSTVPGAERIIYRIIAYVLNQNQDMPIADFTQ